MQKKAFLMDSELTVHINTRCYLKLNAKFDAVIFIFLNRIVFLNMNFTRAIKDSEHAK